MWYIYWKSVYDELVKNSELYKGLLKENVKLKELNKQMQENYDNLNDAYSEILDEKTELEERLDNKEKVNKQLREELGKFVMWNNTVEIVMSAWSWLTEQDDLSPFFMK